MRKYPHYIICMNSLFAQLDSHLFEVDEKVVQILERVLGQQVGDRYVLVDAQVDYVRVELGNRVLHLFVLQ